MFAMVYAASNHWQLSPLKFTLAYTLVSPKGILKRHQTQQQLPGALQKESSKPTRPTECSYCQAQAATGRAPRKRQP